MPIKSCIGLVFLFITCIAFADSTEDLAKQSQNPVANLISVPFQNNTNFGFGPDNQTQNVLNIEPVIPISLNRTWNLITRTILPVINQPAIRLEDGYINGIGDLNPSFFLSPAHYGKLIWGAGPTFLLPTATNEVLGSSKWGAGPALVVLTMPGNWVIGLLTNNIWSFAGDADRPAVNQFTLQYFINYNLPKGWFISSSPIITANWQVASDERWIVPVGGGFGRVFSIAKQPISLSLQGYANVERPTFGPDWTLRLTLSFLFPTKK